MKHVPYFLVLFLTSLWTASPLAYPILQGTPDAATGFNNFEINDTLDNIRFTGSASYLDLFEHETPFFYGDQQGAQQAMNSLAEVMNDFGVTGVADMSPSLVGLFLAAPYDVYFSTVRNELRFNAETVALLTIQSESDWSLSGLNAPADLQISDIGFITFEAASVASPGILWIFLLGFFGLYIFSYSPRINIR